MNAPLGRTPEKDRALALTLRDSDMAMALECIELALQGPGAADWKVRAGATADKFAAYLRAAATDTDPETLGHCECGGCEACEDQDAHGGSYRDAVRVVTVREQANGGYETREDRLSWIEGEERLVPRPLCEPCAQHHEQGGVK